MVTLKQIVVHAPPSLREALQSLTDRELLKRCARRRPGSVDTPTASAKHTLRSLARRWVDLADEIGTPTGISRDSRPRRRRRSGTGSVGADTGAEMLIIFGEDPDRIRSEAASAKLCGACRIPARRG